MELGWWRTNEKLSLRVSNLNGIEHIQNVRVSIGKTNAPGVVCTNSRFPLSPSPTNYTSLRRNAAWSCRLAYSFRRYTTRCKLCNGSRSAHAKLYRWSQSSPLTRMCDRAQSKINTVPQELPAKQPTVTNTTQRNQLICPFGAASSWFFWKTGLKKKICCSNSWKKIFLN